MTLEFLLPAFRENFKKFLILTKKRSRLGHLPKTSLINPKRV